jgi:hypothetical protein
MQVAVDSYNNSDGWLSDLCIDSAVSFVSTYPMDAPPPIALPPPPPIELPHVPLNDVVNLPPAPANPPNHDDVVRLINYRKDIEHAHGMAFHHSP